jgi:hypothetical protein
MGVTHAEIDGKPAFCVEEAPEDFFAQGGFSCCLERGVWIRYEALKEGEV